MPKRQEGARINCCEKNVAVVNFIVKKLHKKNPLTFIKCVWLRKLSFHLTLAKSHFK